MEYIWGYGVDKFLILGVKSCVVSMVSMVSTQYARELHVKLKKNGDSLTKSGNELCESTNTPVKRKTSQMRGNQEKVSDPVQNLFS